MTNFFQSFAVTGVANTTTYDTVGLESTAEEERKLEAVLVSVSAFQGNILEIWHDRERLATIPDYVVRTHGVSAGNAPMVSNAMVEIPVGRDLPIGTRTQVAIRCGASATNLFGSYKYSRKE